MFLSLILVAGLLYSGEVKIIANSANSVTALTKAEVSQFFLKKKKKWAAGKVKPIDQKDSSATRKAFSKEFLGKKVTEIKKYWMEKMFAGRDNPPKIKVSDAAVIAYVKENEGAIGYVSVGADTTGVKVITIK